MPCNCHTVTVDWNSILCFIHIISIYTLQCTCYGQVIYRSFVRFLLLYGMFCCLSDHQECKNQKSMSNLLLNKKTKKFRYFFSQCIFGFRFLVELLPWISIHSSTLFSFMICLFFLGFFFAAHSLISIDFMKFISK